MVRFPGIDGESVCSGPHDIDRITVNTIKVRTSSKSFPWVIETVSGQLHAKCCGFVWMNRKNWSSYDRRQDKNVECG